MSSRQKEVKADRVEMPRSRSSEMKKKKAIPVAYEWSSLDGYIRGLKSDALKAAFFKKRRDEILHSILMVSNTRLDEEDCMNLPLPVEPVVVLNEEDIRLIAPATLHAQVKGKDKVRSYHNLVMASRVLRDYLAYLGAIVVEEEFQECLAHFHQLILLPFYPTMDKVRSSQRGINLKLEWVMLQVFSTWFTNSPKLPVVIHSIATDVKAMDSKASLDPFYDQGIGSTLIRMAAAISSPKNMSGERRAMCQLARDFLDRFLRDQIGLSSFLHHYQGVLVHTILHYVSLIFHHESDRKVENTIGHASRLEYILQKLVLRLDNSAEVFYMVLSGVLAEVHRVIRCYPDAEERELEGLDHDMAYLLDLYIYLCFSSSYHLQHLDEIRHILTTASGLSQVVKVRAHQAFCHLIQIFIYRVLCENGKEKWYSSDGHLVATPKSPHMGNVLDIAALLSLKCVYPWKPGELGKCFGFLVSFLHTDVAMEFLSPMIQALTEDTYFFHDGGLIRMVFDDFHLLKVVLDLLYKEIKASSPSKSVCLAAARFLSCVCKYAAYDTLVPHAKLLRKFEERFIKSLGKGGVYSTAVLDVSTQYHDIFFLEYRMRVLSAVYDIEDLGRTFEEINGLTAVVDSVMEALSHGKKRGYKEKQLEAVRMFMHSHILSIYSTLGLMIKRQNRTEENKIQQRVRTSLRYLKGVWAQEGLNASGQILILRSVFSASMHKVLSVGNNRKQSVEKGQTKLRAISAMKLQSMSPSSQLKNPLITNSTLSGSSSSGGSEKGEVAILKLLPQVWSLHQEAREVGLNILKVLADPKVFNRVAEVVRNHRLAVEVVSVLLDGLTIAVSDPARGEDVLHGAEALYAWLALPFAYFDYASLVGKLVTLLARALDIPEPTVDVLLASRVGAMRARIFLDFVADMLLQREGTHKGPVEALFWRLLVAYEQRHASPLEELGALSLGPGWLWYLGSERVVYGIKRRGAQVGEVQKVDVQVATPGGCHGYYLVDAPKRSDDEVFIAEATSLCRFIHPLVRLEGGIKLERKLKQFRRVRYRHCHKIGVVYAGVEQEAERELLGNRSVSDGHAAFLSSLAHIVELEGYEGYRGGLIPGDQDGDVAYIYQGACDNCVYHVPHLIGREEADPRFYRKRHVGNDAVHIVWTENSARYAHKCAIASSFNDVHVVVRASDEYGKVEVFSRREEHLRGSIIVPGSYAHADVLGILTGHTAMLCNARVSDQQPSSVSLGEIVCSVAAHVMGQGGSNIEIEQQLVHQKAAHKKGPFKANGGLARSFNNETGLELAKEIAKTGHYAVKRPCKMLLTLSGQEMAKFDVSLGSELANMIESVRILHRLSHIDLSHNMLCDLPSEFSMCSELHTLDLSHNLLEIIPSDLKELKSLSVLNLSHNQVIEVKCTAFEGLDSLREVDLSYNSLPLIPLSLLQDCPQVNVTGNPAYVEAPMEGCYYGGYCSICGKMIMSAPKVAKAFISYKDTAPRWIGGISCPECFCILEKRLADISSASGG